jgi:ubiquinone/menaquinone biosynthesis C-methylase UbiE
MVDLRTDQYATGANLSARIALHARFSTSPIRWHEWLFERMSIPPAARILELGCGTGLFWRALAERVPPTWWMLLTDLSEGMVREARRMTSSLPCRVDGAVADTAAIPFADSEADVVVAKHMLYHVPDRERALDEIHRVLVPGGTFYATTIGKAYMEQLVELVATHAPDAPSFRDTVAESFGERTGLEQLLHRFGEVETEIFPDELRVTDADAVLAYIRSLGSWARLPSGTLAAIDAAVREVIDGEGAFVVDAPAVLFSCRD